MEFRPLSWGTSPWVEASMLRTGSPVSGCSTLVTSAPRSARMAHTDGPATQLATSRTLMPCSGPGMGSLLREWDGAGTERGDRALLGDESTALDADVVGAHAI